MHKLINKDQQTYFQVVTSVALPLLPFSSIKHTPQFLKKCLILSASKKFSYLLALFLNSSNSQILLGLILID